MMGMMMCMCVCHITYNLLDKCGCTYTYMQTFSHTHTHVNIHTIMRIQAYVLPIHTILLCMGISSALESVLWTAHYIYTNVYGKQRVWVWRYYGV
ncbi:hypothetical protein EON63_10905 [archaeon]|nr:MAG: hypothetical protein EON63_10905 [archaeon]